MDKKGFTLIELLAVIAIIAVLSGIAVVSYQALFKNSKDSYYEVLENNIKLASNDYFEDHRDKLPVGDKNSSVLISELVSSKYIEQVTDTNGNICDGVVYIYRENNKYTYEVCLDNCDDYKSVGKYCN